MPLKVRTGNLQIADCTIVLKQVNFKNFTQMFTANRKLYGVAAAQQNGRQTWIELQCERTQVGGEFHQQQGFTVPHH